MEFTIADRINLLTILPSEGNIVTLKIIRELQTELGFSEEEIKTYEIIGTDGRVTWKDSNGYKKDIVIGEKANDTIKGAFTNLEKQNKLQLSHLDLYERFMDKPET
jgi:hypothetical protein